MKDRIGYTLIVSGIFIITGFFPLGNNYDRREGLIGNINELEIVVMSKKFQSSYPGGFLRFIYDVASDEYDMGSFTFFREKMANSDSTRRLAMYNKLNAIDRLNPEDLGDFNEFTRKIFAEINSKPITIAYRYLFLFGCALISLGAIVLILFKKNEHNRSC
jgi:hypothetical protein